MFIQIITQETVSPSGARGVSAFDAASMCQLFRHWSTAETEAANHLGAAHALIQALYKVERGQGTWVDVTPKREPLNDGGARPIDDTHGIGAALDSAAKGVQS